MWGIFQMDAQQPSPQLYSVVPVVFAAVLGVLVGTQFSVITRMDRMEKQAERLESSLAAAIQNEGHPAAIQTVSCPTKATHGL